MKWLFIEQVQRVLKSFNSAMFLKNVAMPTDLNSSEHWLWKHLCGTHTAKGHGLDYMPCEEKLRKLELLSLEKSERGHYCCLQLTKQKKQGYQNHNITRCTTGIKYHESCTVIQMKMSS